MCRLARPADVLPPDAPEKKRCRTEDDEVSGPPRIGAMDIDPPCSEIDGERTAENIDKGDDIAAGGEGVDQLPETQLSRIPPYMEEYLCSHFLEDNLFFLY